MSVRYYWIKVDNEWLRCSEKTFNAYDGEKYSGHDFDPSRGLSDKTVYENARYSERYAYPTRYGWDPCEYCPNNTANGGTGICNCTLGQWRVTC